MVMKVRKKVPNIGAQTLLLCLALSFPYCVYSKLNISFEKPNLNFLGFFLNSDLFTRELLIVTSDESDVNRRQMLADYMRVVACPFAIIQPITSGSTLTGAPLSDQYPEFKRMLWNLRTYVIFFTTIDTLRAELSYVLELGYLRTHARFFLLANKSNIDLVAVWRILFFDFYISDANFVRWDNGSVMTTAPFDSEGNCGRNVKRLEDIGYAGNVTMGDIYYEVDEVNYASCGFKLFYYKHFPPYLNLEINDKKPSGVFQRLVHLLNEIGNFNFTTDILKVDHANELTENGTMRLIHDELLNNFENTGLLVPISIAQVTKFGFDCSMFTFEESNVWVMPLAEFVPPSKYLLTIYVPYMYSIIIGAVVATALVTEWLARVLKLKNGRNWKCTFEMIGIAIGVSPKRVPKPLALRILLLGMVILNIHNGAWFSGKLNIFYTMPPREHQLTSYDEILQNNLTFRVNRYYWQLLRGDESGEFRKLLDQAEVLGVESIEIFQDVADNRNIVTVGMAACCHVALIVMQSETNKSGYYVVDFPPIQRFLMGIAIQKGHPILTQLDNVTYTIHGMGLFKKIINDYIYEFLSTLHDKRHEDIPLGWRHVKTHFKILSIGLVIAFVVFVIEQCCRQLKVLKGNKGHCHAHGQKVHLPKRKLVTKNYRTRNVRRVQAQAHVQPNLIKHKKF